MKRITRYDAVAETPIQPERHNPLTIEAGVAIPLYASAVWGVIAAVVGMAIALLLKASFNIAALVFFLTLIAGFTAAWAQYQQHWLRLSTIERIVGRDLDGDNVIGDSRPREIRIRLQDTPTHEEIIHLPEAQLQKLAGCIQQGYRLTERELAGRNKPFSLNEWKALRDELKRRGLMVEASPKAPQQGYIWTKKGNAVMRGVMLDISPAPDADTMRNNDG